MKNKINKKSIIFGIIGLVLMVILVVIVLSSNKGPSNGQLQSDIIQQEIEGIIKTDEFKIIDDNKDKDTYWALVDVTYTKDDVQYNEKYRVAYLKYEDWQLTNIDEYNKELWTTKPTAQPNIEKYKENCKNFLANSYDCSNYDKFEYNQEQSKIDLEKGEAIYAYDVERNTKIEKRTGTLFFDILFDFDKGSWHVYDVSYSDTYKITYDLKKTWTGNMWCIIESSWYDTDDRNVSLTITNVEENKDNANVEGEFVFGEKKYNMKGTISLPKVEKYSGQYEINMKGTNETVCSLNGSIKTADGTLELTINRNYIEDSVYYLNSDIFKGSLSLQ